MKSCDRKRIGSSLICLLLFASALNVSCHRAAQEPKVQAELKFKFKEGEGCRDANGEPGFNSERELSECVIQRNLPLGFLKIENRKAQGADFQYSRMTGTSLIHSNFFGVNLREVSFYLGDCEDSLLKKADLRGIFAHMSKWTKCDLSDADLRGGKFWRARFKKSDLRGVRLDSANLNFAALEDCDLRGASFDSAVVQGTSFRGSRYNRSTRLPFSDSEASLRGMVKE